MNKILELLFLLLTMASWIYWLVAWGLVRALYRTQPEPDSDYTPPVSILKPVKGLDAQAYRNFASFCQQDYPDFELLFGVADPADPIVPVIERLQRDFPQRNIRLVVAPIIGVNRKASTLHHLAAQAQHELMVVSDSDMRATPDYLRRVVAPLADEKVGLVTCAYRGEVPLTLTARLEALHMGVTFLPSVAVARKFLNMRFALGATMAMRRSDLARLGGFAAVADYLADDFQLGLHVARAGKRVHLSNYVMASVLGATTFHEQWQREVRWARCNRASVPWEYQGLLLTFSTPLALTLLVISGFAPWGWLVLAISLFLRWLVGYLVTGYTGDREGRRWLIWLPVRDMLSTLVWCMGEVGRQITWRGEEFVVQPDGRLQLLPSARPRSLSRGWSEVLGKPVRALDALLRRYGHIYEFSTDEDCLLRLAVNPSESELVLSDGTQIHQGDRIGELHFWNEHLPLMPETGPDLAWALAFQRGMIRSFTELAAYVESDQRLQDIKAFRGEVIFGSRYDFVHRIKLARRWGFDVINHEHTPSLWQRFIGFWQKSYALSLIGVFNAPGLQGMGLSGVEQDQIWISRKVLLRRYGAGQPPSEVADHEVKGERLCIQAGVPNLQGQVGS